MYIKIHIDTYRYTDIDTWIYIYIYIYIYIWFRDGERKGRRHEDGIVACVSHYEYYYFVFFHYYYYYYHYYYYYYYYCYYSYSYYYYYYHTQPIETGWSSVLSLFFLLSRAILPLL